jgi:hypothetical protein
MHTVPSYLEIHVHGVDGQVAAFVQSDAGAIRKLLEQIQPGRLFTQRHLTIAGRQSLTLIPCAAVTRVDLVMEEPPDWNRHFGVADALEVTEEEFRQRTLEGALPEPARERPGALFVIGVEIELTNGEQIFLEVHARARPRTPVDVGMFLQQILAAPSLHARRLGGGALVINPAHILRMALSPGPPEPPPNAWPADPLTC